MNNALRVLGITVVLTLIFSITLGERTIFGHIYSVISPATIATQDLAERLFSKSYNSTSSYTKKLFDNSVPKVKDSVKSGLSAAKKGGSPSEHITAGEKRELDELIKTHR